MLEYAKIEDIEARYRVLTDDEKTRATALLQDATYMLVSEFKRNKIDSDPSEWDEEYSYIVKSVVCAMVKRSLISNDGDISSESASVGSYSQSFTYANPTGDLYLKDSERRMLGIELQKQIITSLSPMTDDERQAFNKEIEEQLEQEHEV
jgi:hypothetical protein